MFSMLFDWTARYNGLNLWGSVKEFISEPLLISNLIISNLRPFLQQQCNGVLPNGFGPLVLSSYGELISIRDLIALMLSSFVPSTAVASAV